MSNKDNKIKVVANYGNSNATNTQKNKTLPTARLSSTKDDKLVKKKVDTIQLLYKYFLFFLLGGAIYYCIEIAFRGHSHPSMFVLGGLCYILIGCINEYFPWNMPIEIQAILGGVIITILEFITGYIVNIKLGLGVWDYSNLKYNFMGQICLPFSFIWMGISVIAILLDDHVRYKTFGEEKPRYTSIIANLFTGGK